MNPTVALWGYTQAGKSTALATYLYGIQPGWAAPLHSEAALKSLQRIHAELANGALPSGTQQATEYAVPRRAGGDVLFRDSKGGNLVYVGHDDADTAFFVGADAAAVFVQWPGWPGDNNTMCTAALRAVESSPPDQRLALVVTKVESFLPRRDWAPFMRDPADYARGRGLPAAFVRLLEALPKAQVFATTVFGYSEDGLPNHRQDEFGRYLPVDPRPCGVAEPFDFLLAGLA